MLVGGGEEMRKRRREGGEGGGNEGGKRGETRGRGRGGAFAKLRLIKVFVHECVAGCRELYVRGREF